MRKIKLFVLLLTVAAAPLLHADDVEFAKDIQPIIAAHCYKCHGEKEDKGGLQLHTPELIAEAEIAVGGALDESSLYERIVLPADDDDFMPKGGEPLTAREADLIRRWIEAGADFGDAGGETPDAADAPAKEEVVIPPASEEAVQALRDIGALVMPLAAGDNRLSVGFGSRAEEIGDAQIPLLEGVRDQLVWLDLKGAKITSAGVAPIANLTNLTRLHLERTAIDDAALAHLANLAGLQYLNLYGTNVTDAGVAHLNELKKLKKLFLWQTKVSYETAMKMQETIEGLEVNLGFDHPDVIRARLNQQIERSEKAKNAAAAEEEIAKAAKEAAAAVEAEARKELESLDPKPEAAAEAVPAEEPSADAAPPKEEPAEK